MARECIHGQLARSCLPCELLAERDALRAEVERLTEARGREEWACLKCRYVHQRKRLRPMGEGPVSRAVLLCPRCGGDARPRVEAELAEVRAENERLREAFGERSDMAQFFRGRFQDQLRYARRWKAAARRWRDRALGLRP